VSALLETRLFTEQWRKWAVHTLRVKVRLPTFF